MSITQDNQLAQQASGAADWDSGLNDNFGILDRGYHTTAQAGSNLSSGYVMSMASGGFMVPYDPNSADAVPLALTFTAPTSGESQLFLLTGIVRSLYTSFVPGANYYSSATTPGLLVTTPNGIPVGQGVAGGGIYFRPRPQLSGAVPTGGNSGYVLTKNTSANYDYSWTAPAAGGGGGGGFTGTSSPHRWWGLFNMMPNSGGVTNGNLAIAQIDLLATSGGAPITVQSAFASGQFAAGNDATHAIDNASGYWNANNTQMQNFWIDVGTKTLLAQIAITTRSDTFYWQGATVFDVMWSDDGLKWTPYSRVVGAGFTSANQKQTWNV